MQCRSCGTPLPPEAKLCPHCGAKIAENTPNTAVSRYRFPSSVATFDSQQLQPTPTAKFSHGGGNQGKSQQNPSSVPYKARAFFPFQRRVVWLALAGGIITLLLTLSIGTGVWLTHQTDTSQNPYPPYKGTLVLSTPLSENNNGYYYWDQTTLGGGSQSCKFAGGAYHVTISQAGRLKACLVSGNFNAFAYQVQLTIAKGDEGGVVFHADAAKERFYQFVVSQTGRYALSAYNSGSSRTLSSGLSTAIHPGLNQTNLIAVVSHGSSIDLYVNLQHIASVNESTSTYSRIGVMAEDEHNPTEVVFGNVKVWMLAEPATPQITASAIASVSPSQNPYPPYTGTLRLNDPLSEKSNNSPWQTGTDDSGDSCEFSGGAYHVSLSTQGYIYPCVARIDFRNFAYQVQMTIMQGYGGGIIFCSDFATENFYYFDISRLGAYTLSTFKNNTSFNTLSSGFSSAFHMGLHQTNLIAVVSRANTIDLYVNLQLVTSVNDSTYSHGLIGVVADDTLHPTEVAFSNAKVWQL